MKRLAVLVLATVLTGVPAVLAACSQREAASRTEVHTVAFLRAAPTAAGTQRALLDELRQAGFVLGRNLRVIAADESVIYPDPDEARRVLEDWDAAGVDVIMAFSSSGAALARETAPNAHILFISNDPTAVGLVRNERAPEGRMTGLAFRVPADRTLEITGRVLPGLRDVGVALPRDDAAALANRDVLSAAADQLGMNLLAETFGDAAELDDAIARLAARGAEVLVLASSPAASRLVDETQQAAAEHGLPVVSTTGVATRALVSLAPDGEEMGRQLGRQAARLLSGTRPSAIPVEDPRRFVLTLNAAVAAELGIEFPADVIREAQVVIR